MGGAGRPRYEGLPSAAGGEGRDAEGRGRLSAANAGPRLGELAAQESPARGGEAEAVLRLRGPEDAGDPRREAGADRLESGEGGQGDQERGEERREEAQQ